MQKDLLLYPRHFGPNIHELLVDKLISSVEGSCSGRHGFVVCVTDVFEPGKGKIREGAPEQPHALRTLRTPCRAPLPKRARARSSSERHDRRKGATGCDHTPRQ